MLSKNLSKRSLIITGAIVTILFITFIFFIKNFYIDKALSVSDPSIENVIQPTRSPLPISIKIPKINVNATIEYLGLTSQGAMAVPIGPTDVAWFNLGPRPGEIGSAVIAGHEGWKNNIKAVFDNLHKLSVGDKIYVTNKDGAVMTFVVTGMRIYDQNGDASNIFNSSDNKAHLNLITCEGTWNAVEKSYSNRLVVFTNME